MAFELNEIVPWGRNYDEYVHMFGLTDTDLQTTILGCGDGPASFNAEATELGCRVISVDPVYRFTAAQIHHRIGEVKQEVMKNTWANQSQFRWTYFKTPDDLEQCRLAAMDRFLEDFEKGKTEGRYLEGELPHLPFADAAFNLAVVSHLLFLYSGLMNTELHIAAIEELLRVCKEVRIFPLLDLSAQPSPHVKPVIDALRNDWETRIVKVDYEFQIGGDEMLVIRRK